MAGTSTPSRRTFLRAGLTVAAASATVGLPTTPARASTTAPRPATGSGAAAAPLTRDAFQRHLGATFRMVGLGSTQAVRLVAIDDIRPASASGDRHRFALVFRGATGHATGQGLYTFSRRGLGGMDLLAVPVDRGASARYYQVVVNRPS